MAIIDITNFGGLIPRVNARALPPGAASVNSNLLATSTEFRPMLQHVAVTNPGGDRAWAGGTANAKTLFRGTRRKDGTRITDANESWYADAKALSFVKGQLADDDRDKSYLSVDDSTTAGQKTGNSPPLAIATNPDEGKLLGVPAPARPNFAINKGTYYDITAANKWLTETLVPTVKQYLADALQMDQIYGRFDEDIWATDKANSGGDGPWNWPVAGVINGVNNVSKGIAYYTNLNISGLTTHFNNLVGLLAPDFTPTTQPWTAMCRIPADKADLVGMNSPALNMQKATDNSGTTYYLMSVAVAPFWGRVNWEKFANHHYYHLVNPDWWREATRTDADPGPAWSNTWVSKLLFKIWKLRSPRDPSYPVFPNTESFPGAKNYTGAVNINSVATSQYLETKDVEVTRRLMELFDPNAEDVMALRTQLTTAHNNLIIAISDALLSVASAMPDNPGPAPSKDEVWVPDTRTGYSNSVSQVQMDNRTKSTNRPPATSNSNYLGTRIYSLPFVEPWTETVPSAGGSDNYVGHEGSASYKEWRADYDAWTIKKSNWDAKYVDLKTLNAARVTQAVNSRNQMSELCGQIESLFYKRFETLTEDITSILRNYGLAKTDKDSSGLIIVDADPVKESRFYAATFGSNWGEESAPSPVTEMLEVNQYDTVSVFAPSAVRDAPDNATTAYRTTGLAERGVDKWYLYRTNIGSSATSFQLVAERKLTDMIRAPITESGVAAGLVSVGGVTFDRWLDMAASWIIANTLEPGAWAGKVPTNTWHLVPGDKVSIIQSFDNKTVTKTWSGHHWDESCHPAAHAGRFIAATTTTPSIAAKAGFVDGLTGAMLGEVCPTIGWAEPPYKITYANANTKTEGTIREIQYLKYLTGGAGGNMGGAVDNFVAFCEPGYPYAWPVAYQIPVEYRVTGMGVFGQTWFVGTEGRPYLVVGDHPSNYNLLKFDNSQSCVSHRSIVSSDGGCYYASPDGYCFINMGGVQEFTQGLFAREDWQALDPSTIRAVMHDGVLYFSYDGNGGGTYALDTVAKKLVKHEFRALSYFEDIVTDGVYMVLDDGYIHKMFADEYGVHATGTWSSGYITLERDTTMAWLNVQGDGFSAVTPATITVEGFGPYAISPSAPDYMSRTYTITSNAPVRLHPFRYKIYKVTVQSTGRITRVMLTTSSQELKGV